MPPVHSTVTVAENLTTKPGRMKIHVRVEAFEPCPIHASKPCDCPKKSIGVREKDDLSTQQLAQLVQLNILNTNNTIKDTSNTTHSETANTAASSPTILAGTGTTAAAVTDYTLQTQTETVAATIGSISGWSGTSGTFTVTGTITAGANRAYAEVGLRVTVNTHLYLICHDVFSALNVSNGGTLAVTYTFTFS